MIPLTQGERSILDHEIQSQPYSHKFSKRTIDRALDAGLEIFDVFERKIVPSFCGYTIRRHNLQTLLNMVTEVVPSLVHAQRFFDGNVPADLIRKLRNPTQTHDTLFELLILSLLHEHHKLIYEPPLDDGKRPDFLIIVDDKTTVYIECKSQRFIDAGYHRLTHKTFSQLSQVLDDLGILTLTWAEGLRMEVLPDETASDSDIRAARETLGRSTVKDLRSGVRAGSVLFKAVDKHTPFDKERDNPVQRITATTTESTTDIENVHLAVYPWRGVAIKRRRSQRKLMGEARRQLRGIPADCYGMICLSLIDSKQFFPDIHMLLKQSEYEHIPIVWVNPGTQSKLVWRNDQEALKDRIFGPIVSDPLTPPGQ